MFLGQVTEQNYDGLSYLFPQEMKLLEAIPEVRIPPAFYLCHAGHTRFGCTFNPFADKKEL